MSSSSSRANSTTSLDSPSPYVPIIQCSRLVLLAAFSVHTKIMYIRLCRSANTNVSFCKRPYNHKKMSLMSSSLLPQQYPKCLVGCFERWEVSNRKAAILRGAASRICSKLHVVQPMFVATRVEGL